MTVGDRDVTLREMHVLLVEAKKTLDEIKTDVRAQNGRVRKLENDVTRIKTIWTAVVLIGGFYADSVRRKIGL
jgi:hypothetical protein